MRFSRSKQTYRIVRDKHMSNRLNSFDWLLIRRPFSTFARSIKTVFVYQFPRLAHNKHALTQKTQTCIQKQTHLLIHKKLVWSFVFYIFWDIFTSCPGVQPMFGCHIFPNSFKMDIVCAHNIFGWLNSLFGYIVDDCYLCL